MPAHQLALFNAAILKAPLASPAMAGFLARFDAIHALADAAPGFVWRMRTEVVGAAALWIDAEDARRLDAVDRQLLTNLTLWRDAAAAEDFVYRTVHAAIMARGREWLIPLAGGPLVLWWVPAGTRPTLADGLARLLRLHAHGPGPAGFTFRHALPAPAG